MAAKPKITMEELCKAYDVLNKIYDSVRIISPIRKKIMNLNMSALTISKHSCYEYWASGEVCNNCVSMRAYNEEDTFTKLSWVNGKAYMVLAVPIHDENEIVILELLKDVTNSVTVEPSSEMKKNNLIKALNEVGQLQIKDGLTGIYNRRYIDERLPVDILNGSVNFIPYAVIFADIDFFKKVNDTYGNLAGDRVLKDFSQILQKSITGKDDWVARFGGEEFLIYLKNVSSDAAIDFAENIRKIVERNEFEFEGSIIKITSSFGVFSVHENWNIKYEELLEYADKNLYLAKSTGRNRVCGSCKENPVKND